MALIARLRTPATALVLACAFTLLLAGCQNSGCCPSPCATACDTGCEPVSCAPACEPSPGDIPAEAKAGEAWCRIWIPPETKIVERTICCKPSSTRKIRIPAEYGTRPKLVCVEPPRLQEITRPGVWTTKKRDILVAAERECWQRVDCGPDCDPCVPRQDCWKMKKLPPQFRTVCEPVCVTPPRKEVKFTPARYKQVPETFVIRPARCETVIEPAEFRTIREEIVCRPGRWEWRRNPDCEIPAETPLPALEVEMVDMSEDGTAKGVFKKGETVRYDLVVRSDSAATAMPNLKVTFTLPPQLVFVSGAGNGVTITGSDQAAASSVFPLPVGGEVKMHILAKVVDVPPTTFVQATASVQSEAGDELAVDTESTSLTGAE